MRRRTALHILSLALLAALLLPVKAAASEILSVPSYWLSENKERYEMYLTANPELVYDEAIAYVNADIDKGWYNDVEDTADPDSILIMCNKNFRLPTGYEPADLVSVGGSYKMRSEAAECYSEMKKAANDMDLRFVIYSTYRSYNTQRVLYNSYVLRNGQIRAERYSARAGHSEHQTGLAVDLLHKAGYGTLSSAGFQKTKEYEWLLQHAHEYGFILRYPDGYEHITGYMYEPWHWRYVGVQAATKMHEEEIATFEEYYGKYLKDAASAKNLHTAPQVYGLS